MRNGKIAALLPLMEVNSILTGKRGISLPFTDYCEPLLTDHKASFAMVDFLIDYGRQAGWNYLELRPETPFLTEIPASSLFYGHTLDLSQGEQSVFSQFRDATWRNIRKAGREGVVVTIQSSLDSIKGFYRLNCITRRDHGLPPQPYIFFQKIYEHVIAKKRGFVALASYQAKNIAGGLYFHFGTMAIYKFGASDKSYQHLRANNLVMGEAIKWSCRLGCHRFDFGRTEPENTGLLQFKRGWGAREYEIKYYKYDFRHNTFITDQLNVKGPHNLIFRRMPILLLQLVGSLLYRHMA